MAISQTLFAVLSFSLMMGVSIAGRAKTHKILNDSNVETTSQWLNHHLQDDWQHILKKIEEDGSDPMDVVLQLFNHTMDNLSDEDKIAAETELHLLTRDKMKNVKIDDVVHNFVRQVNHVDDLQTALVAIQTHYPKVIKSDRIHNALNYGHMKKFFRILREDHPSAFKCFVDNYPGMTMEKIKDNKVIIRLSSVCDSKDMQPFLVAFAEGKAKLTSGARSSVTFGLITILSVFVPLALLF